MVMFLKYWGHFIEWKPADFSSGWSRSFNPLNNGPLYHPAPCPSAFQKKTTENRNNPITE